MSRKKFSNHETRVLAVKAVLKGQSVATVAKCYNRDPSAVYRWLQSYYTNKKSFSALKIKRRSGRPSKIAKDICKLLRRDILRPASKFKFETDFWTCRRIIIHLQRSYKIKVSQPTMWRKLSLARLSYQKPERKYFETSKKKQEAWLKDVLPQIKETVKKHHAILYFEDESCIRLTPVLGKTWAPIGKTPITKVTGNRGSVAAISAISSSGSLIFNLHRDKIRSGEIIRFLDQMLKHHSRRHLVVVMDQAKPHIAKRVKMYIADQKRLHVFYLPPRSPEFNPDEKVWNHLKNQELKSHQAKNLKELTGLTRKKLGHMSKNSSLLQGIFFRSDIAKLLN